MQHMWECTCHRCNKTSAFCSCSISLMQQMCQCVIPALKHFISIIFIRIIIKWNQCSSCASLSLLRGNTHQDFVLIIHWTEFMQQIRQCVIPINISHKVFNATFFFFFFFVVVVVVVVCLFVVCLFVWLWGFWVCGQNVCIDYYYEDALDFWTQYMTARFGHSTSQRQVDDPAMKSIQILV